MQKIKIFRQLYFQVVISIIAGILLGHFYPHLAVKMKPLGDGFIKLIRMMIVPIIFTTVVTGIGKMKDINKVGRMGIKALVYFEIVTTFALIIGLLVAHIMQPGAGLNINPAALDTTSIEQYTNQNSSLSMTAFLLNIIPDTLMSAFTKGDILPVLFISILFGFGLLHSGKKLIASFEQLSQVLFAIVGFIMKLAPIGAFGAMAYTIGAFGLHTLTALSGLIAAFYLTSGLFIFVILGLIAKFFNFSLWRFLRYIKEELLIVLGTSTSESVLPRMISKMENLGCGKNVVGLVLPMGYTFNLDGTCIYLTLASLFIAQALHIHLTLLQQLTIIVVLLLTSKGAAAVTGGGFIVLAATLSSLHIIPVAGIVLLLGVDRLMSEVRSLTNLIGNGVATIVIAKWEKDLDTTKTEKVLLAK